MKIVPYLLLILMFACNPKTIEEKDISNNIYGNWSFLDGNGNYNEAFFDDSTYVTFNLKYGLSPAFNYVIVNDSLYSNVDKRKSGLNRIAKFSWLNNDKVVLVTEFSRDTLDRIIDSQSTLQNTDPTKDSIDFFDGLKKRYEYFLIAKGILTKEEVEQFKNDSIVPDDVIKSLKE